MLSKRHFLNPGCACEPLSAPLRTVQDALSCIALNKCIFVFHHHPSLGGEVSPTLLKAFPGLGAWGEEPRARGSSAEPSGPGPGGIYLYVAAFIVLTLNYPGATSKACMHA